jgi:hypothetical protein
MGFSQGLFLSDIVSGVDFGLPVNKEAWLTSTYNNELSQTSMVPRLPYHRTASSTYFWSCLVTQRNSKNEEGNHDISSSHSTLLSAMSTIFKLPPHFMLDTATEPAEVESPIVRQLRDSSTLSAEQVFDELVAVSSSNVQMKCVQRRRSNFWGRVKCLSSEWKWWYIIPCYSIILTSNWQDFV